LKRTAECRPDLLDKIELTEEDIAYLNALENESQTHDTSLIETYRKEG
jgi:hypothetical protein